MRRAEAIIRRQVYTGTTRPLYAITLQIIDGGIQALAAALNHVAAFVPIPAITAGLGIDLPLAVNKVQLATGTSRAALGQHGMFEGLVSTPANLRVVSNAAIGPGYENVFV